MEQALVDGAETGVFSQRWGRVPRAAGVVRRPVAISAIVATVLGVTGCATASRELLVPTAIGVVAEVEQVPNQGRTFLYHLETGEFVEIDHGTADILGGPGGPGEGNLLLSGTGSSGRTWLLGLPLTEESGRPRGCFRLIDTGIGVDGWIEMSNGLRLKKAAGFDPGSATDESYAVERFAFCVNAKGEVTSYGI